MGKLAATALRLGAWTGLAIAAALGAIALLLDPPAGDLARLGIALAAAGLGVGATAVVLAGMPGRLPLWVSVSAWMAVVVGTVAASVAVGAALMFISGHDLRFLLVMLGYGIAVALGPMAILAVRTRERAGAMERAAAALGEGDLQVRIADDGRDELAHVARAFNLMAERLEAAETQRQRLEAARRDLFASVSHDLRTPLATMRAMLEALADGVVDDAPTRDRYIANIGGELRYLSRLVDDLFEVARLDSGDLQVHLEDVRLDLLVREAVDAFEPAAARAGVALAYDATSGGAVVRADPARVSRALYNLVQNAVRHTPADGTVAVRLARTPEGVEVSVIDSGEGIPAEDLPRVFDRFYRVERSRLRHDAGAGLGLAIVRSIVEAHGGSVRAESIPGTGSTFRLTLPVTEPARLS